MSEHHKPIPDFANEAEERAFWESHDSTDYLDWSKASLASQAWIDLAQQRADEIRAGTAKTIPAHQVLDEARRSLVDAKPAKRR